MSNPKWEAFHGETLAQQITAIRRQQKRWPYRFLKIKILTSPRNADRHHDAGSERKMLLTDISTTEMRHDFIHYIKNKVCKQYNSMEPGDFHLTGASRY